MPENLKKKEAKRWALVTGASSGIGRGIAKFLDRQGYCVVLVARNEENLKKAQKDMHHESRILSKDLSQNSQIQDVFTYCKDSEIEIEFLVNDAGFGYMGEFVDEPLQNAQNMIQVNITALVTLTRLFLPKMVERKRGCIVEMGSISSFFPGPYMANYYATKSYVLSFSRALSYELRSSGVHILAVCPGPVETGFFRSAGIYNYHHAVEHFLKTPDQIAKYMWKAFQKKRNVVICGWIMVLLVYLHGIIPHRFLTLRKLPPRRKN